MSLFGRKIVCAKCGGKVDAAKDAFTCAQCGRNTCWACVGNAQGERSGWAAGKQAVVFQILALGDKGEAPCPMCGKGAARRGA